VLIEGGGQTILVDTTPDLRQQALRTGFRHLDAVFITHHHADHIFGFDDLRRFHEMQGEPINVYAAPSTMEILDRVFGYVHYRGPSSTSVLRAEMHLLEGPVEVGALTVHPLPVSHGNLTIQGFLFEEAGRRLGYVPDCSGMPTQTLARLRGVDVMILDALRHRPHPTHFTLEQSVEVLKKIGAEVSYIMHIGHDLDHEQTQKSLPPSVYVPYDELVIEC
jgi:phosphoribosyl 1,2-cyclic phosphate phosphodiesterase